MDIFELRFREKAYGVDEMGSVIQQHVQGRPGPAHVDAPVDGEKFTVHAVFESVLYGQIVCGISTFMVYQYSDRPAAVIVCYSSPVIRRGGEGFFTDDQAGR